MLLFQGISLGIRPRAGGLNGMDSRVQPALDLIGGPPRHNSCRLHRTKNPGAAMKEISGTLWTIIQGPGSSSAVAA